MSSVASYVMFQSVFGYGTTRSQKVLDAVENPENLFDMSPLQMEQLGLRPREISAFRDSVKLRDKAEKTLETAYKLGCKVLVPEMDGYPRRLRNIYAHPLVLYLYGSLQGLDDQLAIGMVGSRRYTSYGKRAGEELSTQLSKLGVAVVSGLAAGIDTICHKAALAAGGRTIAVLGHGLDTIYPAENKELHNEILARGGAVVSEFPPGEKALPFHFPIRNRIISGLSMGVVVVEGTRHSGSLITAGHAITQDRDVFAVPGSIYSPMSEATNWLIGQGGIMVTKVEDITSHYPYITFPKLVEPAEAQQPEQSEERQPRQISFDIPESSVYNVKKALPSYLNENQRRVARELSDIPTGSDAIAVATGMTVPAILSALTQLELFGLVEALPGRRFILK